MVNAALNECHVFLSCVCIWLFPCPRWVWLFSSVHSVQLCFSYYLWLTCVFIVLSVQFDVVWSTRNSRCSCLCQPCLVLPCLVYIKDCYFELHPRLRVPPCCVHSYNTKHKTHAFYYLLYFLKIYSRAVRLIEIEIKSRFEIVRFRFIARFFFFFFLLPAPTSRSMLSEPIRMQQKRTDRAYRQIVW